MHSENDHQLYFRFLSGETAALDELMLRYGDSLTSYLHAVLHNRQDAEDLMIETFARIMVKKPSIRDGCFKAYLFKTGRNLALRFGAKRGRLQTFAIEELTEEPSSPEETEAQFLDQERRLALYRCLNRIEPQYRETLWLVYMEGLSYREASEVLRVSEKKIDRLLQRGKLLLRQELEKEGVTDAYE
jgi:RNA polymerase sigma-70 factor (ECF subfamily)